MRVGEVCSYRLNSSPLLKSLIERLSPPQRSRVIRIELPSLDDIEGVANALGAVSGAVADGDLLHPMKTIPSPGY